MAAANHHDSPICIALPLTMKYFGNAVSPSRFFLRRRKKPARQCVPVFSTLQSHLLMETISALPSFTLKENDTWSPTVRPVICFSVTEKDIVIGGHCMAGTAPWEMVSVCFVVSIALIVPSVLATGDCLVSCSICMPSIPSIFMPGMSSAWAKSESENTVLATAIMVSFMRLILEG